MIPILSYGMGVESTAILLRWLMEPASRILPDGSPFDLADLIIVISQVGDEFRDTGALVDTHIIPLLRQHNVRCVQLGRATASTADGHIVLEDSRQPTRMFLEGQYKLSDEMLAAGTVPQYAGVHKCSLKFKGVVIEGWLKETVYGPIAHTFGYNSEETKRAAKSEHHVAERNKVAMGFGFNRDEPKRVAKGERYDHNMRVGFYPLVDWNWTRQQCKDYIRQHFGVEWKKSACVFCPFSVTKPRLLERQAEHPEQMARALLMENTAIAFNPRSGSLYPKTSLYDLVIKHGNTAAGDIFERLVASMPWALYRVRRIRKLGKGLTKKGKLKTATPSRCVQMLATGTEAEMREKLTVVAHKLHIHITRTNRTESAVSESHGSGPGREERYTIAPATAQDKVRYTVEKFDAAWDDLYCGQDDKDDAA